MYSFFLLTILKTQQWQLFIHVTIRQDKQVIWSSEPSYFGGFTSQNSSAFFFFKKREGDMKSQCHKKTFAL